MQMGQLQRCGFQGGDLFLFRQSSKPSFGLIGAILGLFLMCTAPANLLAQVKLPCSNLGVTKPKLCVSVGVQNGYLRVREVELKHSPSSFPWGRYQSKKEVEEQLVAYVDTVFSKQRLYEMDPPSPGSCSPQPIGPPPATV